MLRLYFRSLRLRIHIILIKWRRRTRKEQSLVILHSIVCMFVGSYEGDASTKIHIPNQKLTLVHQPKLSLFFLSLSRIFLSEEYIPGVHVVRGITSLFRNVVVWYSTIATKSSRKWIRYIEKKHSTYVVRKGSNTPWYKYTCTHLDFRNKSIGQYIANCTHYWIYNKLRANRWQRNITSIVTRKL